MDEQAKHTPGPWQVAKGCDQNGVSFVSGILSGATWVVGNVEKPIKNDADAALIAAAPDMLAMLQELEFTGVVREYGDTFYDLCPICKGGPSSHFDDCRLAALLAAARPAEK